MTERPSAEQAFSDLSENSNLDEMCGKTQGYALFPPGMLILYAFKETNIVKRLSPKELKSALESHRVDSSAGSLYACPKCKGGVEHPCIIFGLSKKEDVTQLPKLETPLKMVK
jgi:hypothetical protein